MSAFPFIRHPTFSEYLTFVRNLECKVTFETDSELKREVTTIQAKNGKTVSLTLLESDIVSVEVMRLVDRRLGIKSKWLEFD